MRLGTAPASAPRIAMTQERVGQMSDERTTDAASVEKPADEAPDTGKAYDPSMDVEDEANIPTGSAADADGDD